jgi:hypothetical protein
MNIDSTILNKIKKLLAMTASPNEAEAAVAMAKAHQLLKEYNLAIEDIEADNRFDIKEETYLTFERERKWKTLLITDVCAANFCSILKGLGQTITIKIVGKEHNILATKIMLDYLFGTIERIAKNVPVAHRESYKLGVVSTLGHRLQDIKKQDMSECTALVVQEKANINQYFNERGGISTSIISYKATNGTAYHKGRVDGENISLNQQIGNSGNASRYIQ